MDVRADPCRPARSPRGDHRPGGPEDGDQRAQFRRARVHGRLRGFHDAHVGESHRRPAESVRRRAPHDHVRSRRQAVCAEREDRRAHGAPARPASCPKRTSWWTASRRPARCSISGCTSSTTPRRSSIAAPAPYFYLPKLESHLEARLWNDVFIQAQRALGVPLGTIRATVLIETLPAAFEMDEILHELRQHAAGLNCGRWDYIFSFIKKHRASSAAILPDRAQITMDKGFLRAYSQLLDPHLSSPRRARHGRHGGADPDQERSRAQRGGARPRARGQAARGRRRPRRHMGRAPGARARRDGDLRRRDARAEPDRETA